MSNPLLEVLVVVRCGVYDQGVVGLAKSVDEAKAIAERAAVDEEDSYHAFEVRQWSPDEERFSWALWSFAERRGRRGRWKPREWFEVNE